MACGCAAAQDYQGYRVFSVTYEYTDQNRTAREQRAFRSAQDECYFAGNTYAMKAGPPQIVSDGGTGFRATQSFYCIGMRGEG